MEDDSTDDKDLMLLTTALKSNSWHEAVMILSEHHKYFAHCPLEFFKTEDRTLTTQLLYAAIDQKHYAVLELLIKQGCDVNYGIKMPYRRYKRSPLFHASKMGFEQIVTLLLEAGADKNCLNNTGSTACTKQFTMGIQKWCGYYWRMAVTQTFRMSMAKTPLHIIPFMSVEEEKQEQCMQLLLEGGADISLKSHCGQTPADVAIQYKFCPLLKCLMKNSQRLGFRTIPYNLESLSERILPEFLLSPLNTDGVFSVAQSLVQLHPVHVLNSHTREEFIRICFMDMLPGFYAMAKKLFRLMLLSGVPDMPTKSPLTLQESCRIFLRRHFGTESWFKINRLPLPQLLVDYLQLMDEVIECAPV